MRKKLKVSISLFIASIIIFIVGLVGYEISLKNSEYTHLFYIGIMVVIFAMVLAFISVLLAFFYLITKNKVRRLDNSYILHNEIEYVIGNKQIRFMKKKIDMSVSNIKSIKMEVNQQIVYNSGITEAIVGGVLFGGSGAVAGSIMGSKPKLSSKAIIYVETDLIQYAGLTITTTPQKGFEICKVIEALMK